MRAAARNIRVNATAALGDSSIITQSLLLSVVWLQQIEVKLFYARGADVEYTSPQLKQRYACDAGEGVYHRLKLRTFGTLTSGQRRPIGRSF